MRLRGRRSISERERLTRTIVEWQPKYLCLNGKCAVQEYFSVRSIEYGQQTTMLGETEMFVVPSTSGAARGYWDYAIWQRWPRRCARMVGAISRELSAAFPASPAGCTVHT